MIRGLNSCTNSFLSQPHSSPCWHVAGSYRSVALALLRLRPSEGMLFLKDSAWTRRSSLARSGGCVAALQLSLVLLAACALSAGGAAGGEDESPLDDVVDSARARTLDQVRASASRQRSPACKGRGQGGVSISYPEDVNREVLGVDGHGHVAGQGQRTYRIALTAGPVAVTGELRYWVQVLADDVELSETSAPQGGPPRTPGATAGLTVQVVSVTRTHTHTHTHTHTTHTRIHMYICTHTHEHNVYII